MRRRDELPAASAFHAEGNRLDKIGDKKRVLRFWQTARLSTGACLEYMQFGADDLRPLVFLPSLEYPTAPSWGFCVDAATAGFGVYSIRRPGFGASDPAEGLDEQARRLAAFFREAGLKDVILVATGSAVPVAARLAVDSDRVGFSIFANCVFNRDIMSEFRPLWFGRLLAQTIESRAGARVSLGAIRQAGRQFGVQWFYQTCFQKSAGDLAYVKAFPREMAEAWEIASAISPETFQLEMNSSLKGDAFLTDGLFRDLPGIALSGTETTMSWKNGFEQEAARLGISTAYLASGDIMSVYQSGAELLNMIRQRTAA